MSTIVPFRSGTILKEREPNSECVKMAEQLLEAAKAGEIVGIAGAACYYDGQATRFCGGMSNYATLGALQCTMAYAAAEHNHD